ncbi:3-oxoacyl-ACP reductase FabG [Nocardiopsis sp. CNT-189]|uniref:SDR family NAD(P)-dependent oxidoreductase n=1 Tax=Nocardiopsis oceanisediminis TaxID=2816862 RepID=UPI003B308264
MGWLDGRAALVTGGSRGIGAAIAERLAADGAAVALTYNASPERAEKVVRRIEEKGGTAVALRADAADPEALTAAVDRAAEELGGLDVLVNNAGIYIQKSIAELTLEEYERVMGVHVRAAFVAVKAALPHLREGARIVSIGSNLAESTFNPGLSLYSMSKAALVGFSKGIARDLGPRGITANVVHPGSTDTEMNPAGGGHADAQRGLTALGRYNTAEEVAGTVAFLAGPAAANITGTAVLVDGGSVA